MASLLLAVGLACKGRDTAVPEGQRRDAELTARQAAHLEALAARADANPRDYTARRASGLAHMRFTLSGVLRLQERAEADLEAAFALDASDPELLLSLGRFYNMRAVEGDASKAATQVEVYEALLGDEAPMEMDARRFGAWSFYQLGRILADKNRGNLLGALAKVESLEETLRARTEAFPQDVEMFALAGNFAFFFAGNVPFGQEARVEAAVRYFERVRADWDAMTPRARDPEHCPNTYENFMFELAEGYAVLERAEEASAIYRELASIRPPITRAKEQIAFVSRERLRNLEHYLGEDELMPPWPSDIGNCVVCHAYRSDVPLTSLYAVEPITLEGIPSAAVPKPVGEEAAP